MSDYKQLHLGLLSEANWQHPLDMRLSNEQEKEWLLDPFSMTKRLKLHCKQLSVDLLELETLAAEGLTPDEKKLLADENCLVREVVLKGDGIAWVYARTLIPFSTLTDTEGDIAELGGSPLGERVFADPRARRDAYSMAIIMLDTIPLLARRTRLWINQKPLLVSELFLTPSPIYQKEINT
jgi:chorismate--pyruvate lyase